MKRLLVVGALIGFGTLATFLALRSADPKPHGARPGSATSSAEETADSRPSTAESSTRPGERRFGVCVRVLDKTSGKPIEGAKIELEAEEEAVRRYWVELMERGPPEGVDPFSLPEQFERRFAATDARGESLFVKLGPMGYSIVVEAKEYPRFSTEMEIRSDAPVRGEFEILLERGLKLSGVVLLPSGDPAPGAHVYYIDERHEADSEGNFEVTGLRPGLFEFHFRHEVAGRTYERYATLEAGTSGTRVDLRLVAERKPLRIEVVGPKGEPVPRASVYVASDGYPFGKPQELVDGTLVLEIEGEAVHVEICNPCDASGKPLPYGPARKSGSRDGAWRLELEKEQAISGRVSDPSGRGIGGVQVEARPVRETWSLGHLSLDRAPPVHSVSQTDPNGHFRLGQLGAHKYRISVVTSQGFVERQSATADAGAQGVEIVLRRDAQPVLEVRGPAASPTPKARIRVRDAGSPVGRDVGQRFWGETDSEGRIQLQNVAAEASYQLLVQPPANAAELAPLLVRDWQPSSQTITLPAGLTLDAIVVDDRGKPVEEAYVDCFAWSHGRDPGLRLGISITGADGRARFEGIPAGSVRLFASHPDLPWGHWAEAVAPSGGPLVRLVLKRGREWTVHIENWGERDFLKAVLIQEDQPHRSSTEYSRAARFQFVGVQAGGTHTLWIPPSDDGMLALLTGLKFTGNELRVQLTKGRPITGRVTIPEKGLEPSVWIYQSRIHFGHAEVDPDGNFIFKYMPEGTWQVSASASRLDRNYRGSAMITAGEWGRVELKEVPKEKPGTR